MDEEEMGAFMEEWLTARLGLSKPGPWHNSGDRYAQCTTVPADFLHPESKPKNWGWVKYLQLCFERWVRCRIWCNRHGITIDTPDTIYIFCIFTICVIECEIQADDHNAELKEHYKKKYGEFLGLPITLAYHDPLRFEIAHREHGKPI
ncbi:hypothetical protein D6C98_10797 [Aureobasidium pullulans]|uniref:Uncharacterized protein n=1 Tax=Aureobasidium pullulans TaxID=5580 RepID=A0A4S9M3Y9_AURPU|nr:hypothetical protein D6D24_06428 [Aureobasidium pullulans]THY37188.1 hypothetical protein D6C98_10797 [Aureobasidium pullulans]